MKLKTIKLPNCLVLICAALLITSCSKNEPDQAEKTQITGAYSIFVDNGSVFISGFSNTNNQITTKYWIDSLNTDSSNFVSRLKNGRLYKKAVDDYSRKVLAYKTPTGENEIYKFDQGSLAEEGRLFYYKNNSLIRLDTTSLGRISTLYFADNKPYFAGYFGEIGYNETGKELRPKTPFIWDGASIFSELPLPKVSFFSFFQGVSSIFVNTNNDVYVGGLFGFPMYWKNSEPVILDDRYGEVNQVLVSGTDVYAAGLINKHNSNSTAHTACYWKNSQLIELEDDAQAYGIYISGADIYISGSIGRIPIQYKACYWKNGIRVDLPY